VNGRYENGNTQTNSPVRIPPSLPSLFPPSTYPSPNLSHPKTTKLTLPFLKNRITGCSDGGLGAALAVAFHEAGLHVYATARNPSKMSQLKHLGIETLTLDVLSDSSIAECVAQIPHLDSKLLYVLLIQYTSPSPAPSLSLTRYTYGADFLKYW